MSESSSTVIAAVRSSPPLLKLRSALPAPGRRTVVGGLHGSAVTALVAALHEEEPGRVLVVVCPDPGVAAATEADLETLLGPDTPVLYPQREALPYEVVESNLEIEGLRVEAVEALFARRTRLLVTTVRALQERAPIPDRLANLRLTIAVGDRPGRSGLVEALEARGFDRVPLVEEVGQFAVRGGIVDLFSFGSPDPARIELWDDEVASIRLFDILDQRSIREADQVHVLPVHFGEGPDAEGRTRRSLLEVLHEDALLVETRGQDWPASMARTWAQVQSIYSERRDSGESPPDPETLFLEPERAGVLLERFPLLKLTSDPGGDVDFATEPAPPVERDMDRLQRYLREGAGMGHRTLLLCDNDGQAERLEEILGGEGRLPPGVQVAVGSVERGFFVPSASPPLRIFTDHEIFRRARRLRRRRRFRGAVSLESLAQLSPGDYVVHLDHGIGRFRGLERVTVAGEEMESLVVEYAGGELLRVPVYRLDQLERWVSQTEDAEPPSLHRIGGKRWKTLRKKTERAIEEMTVELVDLYARRETAKGFAFAPDSRWQREMESAFLYEDTPDQKSATTDVKRDMEAPRPMDRLICGDVGYGKTEVAVRAAFKAVQDGKQVAVLAPTTILVEQHRHTFEERLADFPVKVGALSRFRTPKEQKALLEGLTLGQVDVVLGTHRLLSEDVTFKDLGLLVIDEEQRFGVKHKERLKQLRASVDVLTLTATPIPRTLYLGLSGLRDLTLIRTPPRDRMPIITHVLPWSDLVLSDALQRELDRGGQAFFLHNRVATIDAAAEKLRTLVPEARIEVAHGQMPGRALDLAMTAFVDGQTDVLVCSSIVENGLDVPNANTLVVDRADRFGLAQLYQIRGRVGRSDRRAYCYLMVPERLAEEAERRLKVLEHYTDLGSGYQVALRDLELRGAGNLLGADQSGFAHAVGLETYLRLVEQTVRRIREGEREGGDGDPEVSMAGAALLPEGYISDSGQKLHLYRRLSKIRAEAEIEGLRQELTDRFGPPPLEVERLLDGAVLRLLGRQLGVDRVLVGSSEARVNFRPGVIPRLAALDRPLRDRQVEVEVRRMSPLSLTLRQHGSLSVTETLARAFRVLLKERAKAA